jgi:hypothetical protein
MLICLHKHSGIAFKYKYKLETKQKTAYVRLQPRRNAVFTRAQVWKTQQWNTQSTHTAQHNTPVWQNEQTDGTSATLKSFMLVYRLSQAAGMARSHTNQPRAAYKNACVDVLICLIRCPHYAM